MPTTAGVERGLVGGTIKQGDGCAGVDHGGLAGQGARQTQPIQKLEQARPQHEARAEGFNAGHLHGLGVQSVGGPARMARRQPHPGQQFGAEPGVAKGPQTGLIIEACDVVDVVAVSQHGQVGRGLGQGVQSRLGAVGREPAAIGATPGEEGRELVRRRCLGHGQAGDLAVCGGCQRHGQSAQTGGEDEAFGRRTVAGGDVAAAGVADRQGAAGRLYRRDRGVADPAPERGLDIVDIGRQGGVGDDGGEGFRPHAAVPSSTLRNRWVRCSRSPPMRSN
ncbi:hypothetical protein D3C72_795770 [compost metagenome]